MASIYLCNDYYESQYTLVLVAWGTVVLLYYNRLQMPVYNYM